jgi:HD-GYP domain-containing protein (c-di-GMP phosphodiesterase class II)
MKQKISTDDLQLGMYVIGVDAVWFDHPLWQPNSLLEEAEVIRVLEAAHIKEVWIDPSKGLKPRARASRPDPICAAPREPPRTPDAPLAATQSTGRTRTPAATQGEVSQRFIGALAEPKGVTEAPVTAPPSQLPDPSAADQVALPPPKFEPAPLPVNKKTDFASDLVRARRVCAAAGQEVASMFRSVRMGRAIGEDDVLPIVRQIAKAVQEIPSAILSVARLKTHDNYTYLHSVAVCALMTALARQLGMDEDQTHDAGVGGLLHDLGKALVDPDILSKPGALDANEFAAVKKHPRYGYELLKNQADFTDAAKDVVLHHHETFDGAGYPDGIAGNQIALLARMGAVCDVYDAITSNRPYKEGWDPALAIRRMAQWHGHFDEEIFKQFIATVGIFPVGSLVALDSGRLAVVLQPGTSTLSRPIVRAFFSIRSNEPIAVETIDLGSPGCQDRILRPEDPTHWGFKHLDRVLQA